MNQSVCVLSDRPAWVDRDERGRLHSMSRQAIQYRDGWGFYCVHGVRLSDAQTYIVTQPEQITVAAIDAESNAEVRRVMIERYGQERYIRDSGAVLVDSRPADFGLVGLRDAKLYRKELSGDEPIICLDMLNSTPEPDGTTKRYTIRVSPNEYGGRSARDCLAAMASTYRMADGSLIFKTPEDYAPGVET
jgi:hypothetical protein